MGSASRTRMDANSRFPRVTFEQARAAVPGARAGRLSASGKRRAAGSPDDRGDGCRGGAKPARGQGRARVHRARPRPSSRAARRACRPRRRGGRTGRADRVHDRRLQRRPRGARSRSRRRGDHDHGRALRADRPAARIRSARGGRFAGRGSDRGGGHAEDTSARRLPRPLDDGPGAAGPRAPRADGDPDPGRRSAVRRRDPSRSRRPRLPHDLGSEVALRTRVDRSPGRRRSRTVAGRAAELLLAAGVRARWRVRAVAGSSPLRPQLGADRAHERAPRRDTASSRVALRARRRRWPSDAGSCSRAQARTWSRRTSARPSSPGVRRGRRRPMWWHGSPRPEWWFETSRKPGSCGRRSAGGRARATSNVSSPL